MRARALGKACLVSAALSVLLVLSGCQRPSSFGEDWSQEQWRAYHERQWRITHGRL